MSNTSFIDRKVEEYEMWKQEKADKMLAEEIEDLESTGIKLSDDAKEQMRIHYDMWVEKETERYRYILESEASDDLPF